MIVAPSKGYLALGLLVPLLSACSTSEGGSPVRGCCGSILVVSVVSVTLVVVVPLLCGGGIGSILAWWAAKAARKSRKERPAKLERQRLWGEARQREANRKAKIEDLKQELELRQLEKNFQKLTPKKDKGPTARHVCPGCGYEESLEVGWNWGCDFCGSMMKRR